MTPHSPNYMDWLTIVFFAGVALYVLASFYFGR